MDDSELVKRLTDALREYDKEQQEKVGEEDAFFKELSTKFQNEGCISDRKIFVEKVVDWKSSRSKGYASRNGPGRIRSVTREAFQLSKTDVVKAVDCLTQLEGVEARVATAILTFYDPTRFTVMDWRAWRSLVHLGFLDAFDCWFEEASDYPVYLEACQRLAAKLGWTLRDTDRALWRLAEKGTQV